MIIRKFIFMLSFFGLPSVLFCQKNHAVTYLDVYRSDENTMHLSDSFESPILINHHKLYILSSECFPSRNASGDDDTRNKGGDYNTRKNGGDDDTRKNGGVMDNFTCSQSSGRKIIITFSNKNDAKGSKLIFNHKVFNSDNGIFTIK